MFPPPPHQPHVKTIAFDPTDPRVLYVGIEQGVIQKSGAWFAYGDERIGQGRENARKFLKENQEVRERIVAEIYGKLGLDRDGEDAADAEERPVEQPAGRTL